MSKNNLAMAYAMKRKGKKMAHGGMVDDDEPEAGDNEGMAGESEQEPSEDKMKIMVPMMHGMVEHIMGKRMAKGGMVNEEDSADGIDDQYSEMPGEDDDFLSDEEQDSLPNEDMKSKRRGLLDSIMSKK